MSKYKIPFFESIEDLRNYLEVAVQCVNSDSWNSLGCVGAVCHDIGCDDCLFSSNGSSHNQFFKFLESTGCTVNSHGKWKAPKKPKNVGALVRTKFICDASSCSAGPCRVALPYPATPASVCIRSDVYAVPNWHATDGEYGTIDFDDVKEEKSRDSVRDVDDLERLSAPVEDIHRELGPHATKFDRYRALMDKDLDKEALCAWIVLAAEGV